MKTSRASPFVPKSAEEGATVLLNLEKQRLVAKDAGRPRGVLARPRHATTLRAQAPLQRREQVELVPLAAIENFIYQGRLDKILAQIII